MTEKFYCDRAEPQRRVCILDPMLVLSRYGLMLVKHLGTVLDLWIGREFWHLLDAAEFYRQQPELLLPPHFAVHHSPEAVRIATAEIEMALKAWSQMSMTHPNPLRLFWFGDRLWESVLPDSIGSSQFAQWELLARSLDAPTPGTDCNLATLAFRDAIALAAVLETAFILTYQPITTPNLEPPEICRSLEHWQIPAQVMTVQDAAVTTEQDWLRQCLMQVGLIKLLWADVQLSVLHLLIPPTQDFQATSAQDANLTATSLSSTSGAANVWQGARGFWYPL